MLLVNARLPLISVDVWYKRLPTNTAVLTIGTKILTVYVMFVILASENWQKAAYQNLMKLNPD